MSKKIVPSQFKTNLIEQFLESLSEAANTTYYAFVGDHITEGETEGDVSQPTDSARQLRINSYRDMIFGKKLLADDLRIMCKRNNWVQGTTYTMYDDAETNIFDTNFIVAVDETSYVHVYKCLYNANGAPSVTKPVFADVKYDAQLYVDGDDYYETDDGYQWKYMYTIDSATFRRFASQKYIPVIANTAVQDNAKNGAIDVIKVDTHGQGYVNHTNGQFTSGDLRVNGSPKRYRLPDGSNSEEGFYSNTIISITSGTGAGQYRRVVNSNNDPQIEGVQIELETAFAVAPDTTSRFELSPEVIITADGTQTEDAVARAVINATASHSVHKVEMLNTGRGYNYATAVVAKGSSPVSGTFDNIIDASVRPIIPPTGGHGANTNVEVGGSYLGFHAQFIRDENGTVQANNTFAQFGIIRDPLFANVEISFVKSSDSGTPGSDGTFVEGERFIQFAKWPLDGVVTLTASSNVVSSAVDMSYSDWLTVGTKLYFEDQAENVGYNFIADVTAVTNGTHFTVNSTPTWGTANTKVYEARPTTEGVIKDIQDSSSFYATELDDHLVPECFLMGLSSYASANVQTINVNNRFDTANGFNFDFGAYNQMTRVEGSINSGTFQPNEQVYQGNTLATSTANAYVHSTFSNGGTDQLWLTRVEGTFDTGKSIKGDSSTTELNAGFDKYEGELDPTTGTVIFLQNDIPVEREGNQSEEIRVILEF